MKGGLQRGAGGRGIGLTKWRWRALHLEVTCNQKLMISGFFFTSPLQSEEIFQVIMWLQPTEAPTELIKSHQMLIERIL